MMLCQGVSINGGFSPRLSMDNVAIVHSHSQILRHAVVILIADVNLSKICSC